MTTLCRDCVALTIAAARNGRCGKCGSPRQVYHATLDRVSIAHVDCDALDATVEGRDRPGLADRPVIIGGGFPWCCARLLIRCGALWRAFGDTDVQSSRGERGLLQTGRQPVAQRPERVRQSRRIGYVLPQGGFCRDRMRWGAGIDGASILSARETAEPRADPAVAAGELADQRDAVAGEAPHRRTHPHSASEAGQTSSPTAARPIP